MSELLQKVVWLLIPFAFFGTRSRGLQLGPIRRHTCTSPIAHVPCAYRKVRGSLYSGIASPGALPKLGWTQFRNPPTHTPQLLRVQGHRGSGAEFSMLQLFWKETFQGSFSTGFMLCLLSDSGSMWQRHGDCI